MDGRIGLVKCYTTAAQLQSARFSDITTVGIREADNARARDPCGCVDRLRKRPDGGPFLLFVFWSIQGRFVW